MSSGNSGIGLPVPIRVTSLFAKPGGRWQIAFGVFIAAFSVLWVSASTRFLLTFDEGIYLEGALRIGRGQVPYRDFFLLTGPGSLWLHAAVFKLLGTELFDARIPMIVDVAFLTAAVYWLTARLTRPAFALGVTFFFFAVETGWPFRLYANHRWDSAAFAMAAIVLLFAGVEQPHPSRSIAAGFCAAAAIWITPAMIPVAIALGTWITFGGKRRWVILFQYCLGMAACSVVAGSVLLAQGALGVMLRYLVWDARNYFRANRVPYGFGIVDAHSGNLSLPTGTIDLFVRTRQLVWGLLPVVLPIATYVGWALRLRKYTNEIPRHKPYVLFLLIASGALIVSTYPRWSADQLLFAAPIFYVLTGILLDCALRGRLRRAVFLLLLSLALHYAAYTIADTLAERKVHTQAGWVRVAPRDEALLTGLQDHIHPGDTLFVFPYMPILYFVTGGVNPTRYSFLQPGMMTIDDQLNALADLRAQPPNHVLYCHIPVTTYLQIWPRSDPNKFRMKGIDEFIQNGYRETARLKYPGITFAILDRVGPKPGKPILGRPHLRP